jgi:hypothetical protein
MNHRGLELAQLPKKIERLGSPSGHELEPLPRAAALELDVDRARLTIERELVGAIRVAARNKIVRFVMELPYGRRQRNSWGRR